MDTVLAWLLALVALLSLVDVASVLFGAESRDGFADDRLR